MILLLTVKEYPFKLLAIAMVFRTSLCMNAPLILMTIRLIIIFFGFMNHILLRIPPVHVAPKECAHNADKKPSRIGCLGHILLVYPNLVVHRCEVQLCKLVGISKPKEQVINEESGILILDSDLVESLIVGASSIIQHASFRKQQGTIWYLRGSDVAFVK